MAASSLVRHPLLALVCGLVACARPAPPSEPPHTLTDGDRAAIQTLEDAYAAAWLASDTLGVLDMLDPAAVLLPGGQEPVVGLDAIRAFWWPRDGSRTVITRYVSTLDELEGTADLAYSRGRGELAFTYEQGGTTSALESTAISLTLYRRQQDGTWRILRRMWAPLR